MSTPEALLKAGLDVHGGLRVMLRDGEARCHSEPGVDPVVAVNRRLEQLEVLTSALRTWLIQYRQQQIRR